MALHKKTSKSKTSLKDTPPDERYAAIIAEEFSSRFDLLFENIETIRKDVGSRIESFEEKVMKEFVRVDMRFMGVDQRFDKVESRLGKVENELKETRKELKGEIEGARQELKGEIKVVREELKGEIKGVREELKGEIKETRNELSEKMDHVGKRMNLVENDIAHLKEAHPS